PGATRSSRSIACGGRNCHQVSDRGEEHPRDRQSAAARRKDDRRIHADDFPESASQEAPDRERAPDEEAHRRIEPTLNANGDKRLPQTDLIDVVPQRPEGSHEHDCDEECKRQPRRRKHDTEGTQRPSSNSQDDRPTDADSIRESVRRDGAEDPADSSDSANGPDSYLIEAKDTDRI